ncbi:DNA N-6-adenine-methyltransferase [Paenibacillus sp. sgz302251]|uniref:DNA N-6-adenine-methyltransferase n=1 Tax=Paenibacillus sp. sgz302251 TaxID=3414493 RepID=UPI003C7B46AC
MVLNEGMFSSSTYEWETPQDLFDELNIEFKFDLDVCATESNKKCERYFTIAQNGLRQEWTGVCWMNPPYGRGIHKWVQKAYESSLKGVTVVCLLPARTDTKWWHEYCEKVDKNNDIRFIKRRIRFGGSNGDAPFPSVVVVFRGSSGSNLLV